MNIFKIMFGCCIFFVTCSYVHAMELSNLPDDVLIHIVALGNKSGLNIVERRDFATIMKSVSHRFFVLSKSSQYAREMNNNVGDLAFVNFGECFQHMFGKDITLSSDYELMRYRLLRENNKGKKLFCLNIWLNECLKKNKALTIGGIFVGSFSVTLLLATLLRVSLKKTLKR